MFDEAFAPAPSDPLERIKAKWSEYRRLGEVTGAGGYPADNRCHRCADVSPYPLVPSRDGWGCRRCSY